MENQNHIWMNSCMKFRENSIKDLIKVFITAHFLVVKKVYQNRFFHEPFDLLSVLVAVVVVLS